MAPGPQRVPGEAQQHENQGERRCPEREQGCQHHHKQGQALDEEADVDHDRQHPRRTLDRVRREHLRQRPTSLRQQRDQTDGQRAGRQLGYEQWKDRSGGDERQSEPEQREFGGVDNQIPAVVPLDLLLERLAFEGLVRLVQLCEATQKGMGAISGGQSAVLPSAIRALGVDAGLRA